MDRLYVLGTQLSVTKMAMGVCELGQMWPFAFWVDPKETREDSLKLALSWYVPGGACDDASASAACLVCRCSLP
jgi:hypothetical protein